MKTLKLIFKIPTMPLRLFVSLLILSAIIKRMGFSEFYLLIKTYTREEISECLTPIADYIKDIKHCLNFLDVSLDLYSQIFNNSQLKTIMENTIQNKEKFFALYFGQTVMMRKLFISLVAVRKRRLSWANPEHYLELTPLSLISDEDAIMVAKMWYDEGEGTELRNVDLETSRNLVNHHLKYGFEGMAFEIVDYLRSKGYALPWNGISVEQQIEYGWVKLKTE
jgi:hypothetical protein